jgi:hypothetical protein
VHFYGVKYFARENAGKNHDAFVARCFVPDDCARLAKQNDARSGKVQCGRTIPTSGSIELLKP